MRKLKRTSSDYRLTGNSVAEVVVPFKQAVLAVGTRVRFNGAALEPTHILNGLVLRFVRLAPDEQVREAARLLESLADFLEDAAKADEAEAKAAASGAADVIAVRDLTGNDEGSSRPKKAAPRKK